MNEHLKIKNQVIQNIGEKVNRAFSFALLNYHGLSVKDLTLLRQELKENNSELKVYKNTLLKRALHDKKITDFDQELKGPNAVLFDYAEGIHALKLVNKFCKKNKNLKLRGGLFNDKKLDENAVTELASIPEKDVLLSMLVISLKMPLIKLVCTLKTIKK